MKIRAKLSYLYAALTLVIAAAIPFSILTIAKGVAATGVKPDRFYAGGAVVRTIDKGAYRIQIHEIVRPRALERGAAYRQFDWTPLSALPPQVSDEIDVNQDGKPDLQISFAIPKDESIPLKVEVVPRQSGYEAMHGVGKESFSRIIARVNDQIVVRVPVD